MVNIPFTLNITAADHACWWSLDRSSSAREGQAKAYDKGLEKVFG
jgi:hypothetical protein